MAYDYKNKSKNIKQLVNYMFTKTLSMFEYAGLPETIPRRELERLLQVHGYAFITKAPDGQLYAFTGSLGGQNKSPYGEATEITIANVALNFNKTLSLETDGVLIRNDDLMMGLMPYYEKQNTLIIENDINMVVWGYNSRSVKTISAPDDKTKESADAYLKKTVDGEISVIGENPFFDGVKVQTAVNTGGVTIQSMIEYHQYLTAKMYNEIGLSANFNMKRERLISSELDQSEDSLFPMVYNMMANRISGIEAVNNMFTLEIRVDFGSVWALKNKELVDGNPDNNDTVNNGDADNANNAQPSEQAGSGEQDGSGEQETGDTNTQSENGNDNGSGSGSEATGDGTDTNENNGVDNGRENQDNSRSDQNDSTNNSESEEMTAEQLQAIIDNIDNVYSDDEIQAARSKLAELEKNNVTE